MRRKRITWDEIGREEEIWYTNTDIAWVIWLGDMMRKDVIVRDRTTWDEVKYDGVTWWNPTLHQTIQDTTRATQHNTQHLPANKDPMVPSTLVSFIFSSNLSNRTRIISYHKIIHGNNNTHRNKILSSHGVTMTAKNLVPYMKKVIIHPDNKCSNSWQIV